MTDDDSCFVLFLVITTTQKRRFVGEPLQVTVLPIRYRTDVLSRLSVTLVYIATKRLDGSRGTGTFRAQERIVPMGNFRSREFSFPGTFVSWERKFPGTFVPWTFRSKELSFPGTFVPPTTLQGIGYERRQL